MTFGLHKLWFFYTDEWFITDDKLATQIGVYSSLAEAEAMKVTMEIEALKNMNSYDYIRDLTGFMEKANYDEKVKALVEFAKEQGWDDHIREQKYDNSDKTYFELSLPKRATDEQLKTIIDISGAYFCKIVEYKEVKKSAYIKFNHEFWGNKIFKALKEDGIIEDRSPLIQGEKNKGKYFVQKPPKGRKSATIKDIEAGLQKAIEIAFDYINQYPEFSFIGKCYFDDLSDSPITLASYLNNCKNIALKEELVDSSNHKKLTAKLKKLKSSKDLQEGDQYTSLEFSKDAPLDTKELQGFFNLLKIQPFTVFEIYSEINGEEIKTYYPDHDTF